MTFLPRATTHPSETALVAVEGDRTWAELESNVRRYANGMAAMEMGPGDAVAVLSFNRPEFVEVLLGNLRSGVKHVPLNWHLNAQEIAYILQDSGARLLICDPDFSEIGRQAAAEAGIDRVMVMGPELATWLAEQDDAEPANTTAGFMLQYTSGTTGRQKGVLRQDRASEVSGIMERFAQLAKVWKFEEGGAHLVVCPLYHATPPAHVLFALSLSQRVVITRKFDAEETLALVERHRITTLNLVPTQLIRILRLPEEVRRRYDTSSLVGVWHGAAPCPDWVKRQAIEELGPILIEYFGSSEGTGPVLSTSAEWLERPGTVGRPAPWLEISVVDDDGRELPTGEVGTLYFRRPEGPPSYHGAPDKTAESRRADGWFTVGDVGSLDEDGFLYLADRKIDMIISGGVNIYPRETEAVLVGHPDVVDCAVFGIPDPEWGEQVKAAVQLRPGAVVTEEALIAYCREQLAGYKCPRSVDFHDELPREASGKLKKRLLRDAYTAAASATGDAS